MDIEEIKASLHKLEKLMYGCNFEVTFGIELFVNCATYNEFSSVLSKVYPESKPFHQVPILFSQVEFWEDLNECLDYRGDNSSGLSLNLDQSKAVEIEQTKYRNVLKQFIKSNAQIFAYPDIKGIPGYPVFWDYRYILFNGEGDALFIYGSSSD